MLNIPILQPDFLTLSEDEFLQFCRQNRPLRFERDKFHRIVIMPPTGSETSYYNSNLLLEVGFWNRKENLGLTFDSNGGFTLPDGSIKAPDVAWVQKERYFSIPEEKRKGFAPLCPDFVIELRSPNDSILQLQEKMKDWIVNGCRLGWLIVRETKTVYIYRADGSMSEQNFEEKLSGEDVLVGFELDLKILE